MRTLHLTAPTLVLALVAIGACTKEPASVAPATIAAVPAASASPRPLASGADAPSTEAVAPVRDGTLLETSGDVPIYADDPQWGDGKTPALVVFVDLQCPHCAVFHKMLVDATRRPSTRIVWKHFPLRSHAAARPAAEAAQGVFVLAGGDAFARFVDRVFAASAKGTALTTDAFVRWAADSGVRDPKTYREGLDDHRWAATVDRDLALADKLKLMGTPSLFIDGELYDASNEDLSTAIARHR